MSWHFWSWLHCIMFMIILIQWSHEEKSLLFKYTFFALQYHFCFTLGVEGILLNSILFLWKIPIQIIILFMDYDVAFRLRKKWKLNKVSDFTVKLPGFCFFSTKAFKEITQKLFQICLIPWKNNWCYSIIQLPIALNHYWLSVQTHLK